MCDRIAKRNNDYLTFEDTLKAKYRITSIIMKIESTI